MPLRALPNFCICCRIAFFLVYNTRKARESPIPQAKNRPVFSGGGGFRRFLSRAGLPATAPNRGHDRCRDGNCRPVPPGTGISGSLANFRRMPGSCFSCPSSPGRAVADGETVGSRPALTTPPADGARHTCDSLRSAAPEAPADKKPPPPIREGGCVIARAGHIISSWANCTARFRIAMNGCVRRNSARVRSSRSSESRNSSVIRLAI